MEFLDIEQYNSLLVVAPHPDDEVLGAGGVLIKARNAGIDTHIVYVTDGEALMGEPSALVARKRRDEAREVGGVLGISESIFLGFPDGNVVHKREELTTVLSKIIKVMTPALVLAPSPVDFHSDHIATSEAVWKACKKQRYTLAFYEVYSSVKFSHLVDISEVIEEKEKLINTYNYSLYNMPHLFTYSIRGFNAHKSIFVHKEGFYEAFYLLNTETIVENLREFILY